MILTLEVLIFTADRPADHNFPWDPKKWPWLNSNGGALDTAGKLQEPLDTRPSRNPNHPGPIECPSGPKGPGTFKFKGNLSLPMKKI